VAGFGDGGYMDPPSGVDGVDLIRLGGGNDFAQGDTRAGFPGASDEIYGEAGRDALSGQNGDDRLYGGDGNDLLEGDFEGESNSPDYIPDPTFGSDLLDGGDGDDTIEAHPGADEVLGGPGNDVVYSQDDDGAADNVSCGEGDRDFAGFGENDLIGSDCEVVLLTAVCPQGQVCEAVAEVVTTAPPARGARRGATEKTVLASDEFDLKGRKRVLLRFRPQRVQNVLAATDEVDVVRKLTVKYKRQRDKKATRFLLTRP